MMNNFKIANDNQIIVEPQKEFFLTRERGHLLWSFNQIRLHGIDAVSFCLLLGSPRNRRRMMRLYEFSLN